MEIAMIGAGNYAKAHLSVLSKEPGIEIVGHVSRTPGSREASAQRWGGRTYATCESLLKNEQVDAAWITVPPGAHGEIEESLIARGIPFFVEKPLSANRQTAERIAASIAKHEIIAGVGYKWRAMDTIPEVRQLLTEKPAHLILAGWHGGTPPLTWWQRQETGGGQMVEQATHLFDIARHLMGEATVIKATADRHPRQAYPNMNVADTSTALLHFETGAKGVFTATCLLEGTEEIYVKLVCEGLLITINREGVTFDAGHERREVRVGEDLITREDRAFLAAVRRNDPSLLFSSYEDALLTHRLCFDVFESSTLELATQS